MKYYKFLKKGTYKTLHIGTELPPPGKPSRPIPNIQPSGSAGPNSGVGYHMYPEAILPFITGDVYNDMADLWEVQPCGYTQEFLVVKDPPAFVFPPEPMMGIVAESIKLIKKVSFVVSEGKLTFCQEEIVMPFIHSTAKKKNFFKRLLERRETYWKWKRWVWRRTKNL